MTQATLVPAIVAALIAACATPSFARPGDAAETSVGAKSSEVAAEPAAETLDWTEMVATDDGELPLFRPVPNATLLAGPSSDLVRTEWTAPYQKALQLAYAHARLGHTEYARFIVREIEDRLEAALADPRSDNFHTARLIAQVESRTVRRIAAHIEARIAFDEGRSKDAYALAAASDLDGPTGVELAAAVGLPADRAPTDRPLFANARTREDAPLTAGLAALNPSQLALPAPTILLDETGSAPPTTLALSSMGGVPGMPTYPGVRQPYAHISWAPGIVRQVPWQLAGILPQRPPVTVSLFYPSFD